MRKAAFVGLALCCAAAGGSEAGEFRGRLLVGERPAVGVTVFAVPYETPFEQAQREARRTPAPKALASALSGGDGSFVLSVAGDASGRGFRLRVEGPGVVPILTAGVYDANESEDVGDEPLAPARKLAGRVVDEKGKPVPGAEVTLVSRNFGGGPFQGGPFQAAADVLSVPRTVLTGADGSFRFDDARPQSNRLTVEAKGYATAEVPNVREGALPRPIALQAGISLSGVVRTSGKAPAKGALVRFEGKADSRWVETGADGSFRLADLPAGGGTLVADGGDQGMTEVRGLTLPDSAAQRREVVLAPSAAIEGRVVDAKSGASISRVKVLARSGGRLGFARSGSDGRYRIAGLLPNRYRVEADDPRYVLYDRNNVVLLAGASEKVDVPLTPGATISGRVVDEEGRPIANARGRLVFGSEGGLRAFMRQQRGGDRGAFRTTVDGTFKATRRKPGDGQSLTVTHPDFEARTLGGLSLPAGGTRAGVSVVLSRGLSLAGIVKDGEGNPVAGAELFLNQARTFRGGRGGAAVQLNFVGGPDSRERATSGSDGRFEFKGLTKGDYMLAARKPGFSEAILDPAKVVEDGEPVELVIAAGASISGLVVDSNGQPAEGYFVQVRARSGGNSPMRGMGGGPGGPGRNVTGPDGFFSIDGLHAGESYDLMVLGADGLGPRREGVTAPAEGVELVVPGKGKIAGRVLEAASGQPVSDFEITFNPDRSSRGGGMVMRFAGPGGRGRGAGQREQLHSEDGSFVLDEVPPGTWEVDVDAKGYQAGRVGGIVIESGQTKDGVVVKLSRGSGIRGRVLDAATGRPVPDARVTTETAGGQMRMPVLDFLNGGGGVPADADGLFEIDGLSQGRYLVSAEHPDFSDASLIVDVKEGIAAAELRLQAGGALGGVVMSETRRALPGARVVLEPAGDGGGLGGRRGMLDDGKAAVTDAQGRFRFDHLTSGRYRVVASLRDRATPPLDVVLQASEARDDLQLQLQAGATIRGFVSGLPQGSRGNVNVTATGPESYFASTRTGADAAFELSGVPSGSITLRATTGDFLSGSVRSATANVSVPDGQPDVSAEIVFEIGYMLSGTVTRGGQPVPDAFVLANLRGGGGISASARSDGSGSYHMEGLKEGEYNVSSGGGSRPQEIKIAGDTTLDIQIPVARLAGTVVEMASKQPLADATVEADSGEAQPLGPRMIRGSATDSNGRFALEDLEPKAYTLTARRAGFQYEKRQFTAAETGSDEIVIELQRGEGIGLQATDGIFGVPLRGLSARVLDAAGASVFMGNVSLDSEGRGEIPSIKPGQYSVMVDASGYAPASFPISVPAPPVAVVMTPGGNVEIQAGPQALLTGSLTIQFTDSSGRPYAYTIFGPPGRLVLSTPVRLIENFAPGRYTLSTTGGKPQPFTVAEGQTTIVALP